MGKNTQNQQHPERKKAEDKYNYNRETWTSQKYDITDKI